MKTLQEKKIEKLEDIIEQYKMFYDSIHSPQVITINEDLWNQHLGDLESELTALDKEIVEKKNITKWDNLNAEFNNLLETLSDEEWQGWYNSLPKREMAEQSKEIEQGEQRKSAEGIYIDTKGLCNNINSYIKKHGKMNVSFLQELISDYSEFEYASQSGYPEEFEKFCIWFKKNTQSTDLGYYHVIEEHGRFAFFELYNYWLTNIKDK